MPDQMHWRQLTDEQIIEIIHARGKELEPGMVNDSFIRAMRHYRSLYPEFPPQILSFMVRIDMEDGINTCSCGEPRCKATK